MQDFTIPKSPYPIIYSILGIIVGGEAVFALMVFMLTLLRSSLNVDSTFLGLFWLLFFIKAAFIVGGVAKTMFAWIKKSYMVVNNQLITYTAGTVSVTNSDDLADVRSIKVVQSSLGKKSQFGNIELHFSQASYSEVVTLEGVANPKEIAKLMRSVKKSTSS